MQTIKLSPKTLNATINAIKNGGVIVCPTDTVYGFLADATNKKAVEKIFKIKKRPKKKPLAVFVKDIETAKKLAEISPAQEKILRKYWPGKYTFILKSKIKNFTPHKNLWGARKSKIQTKNQKLSKLVLGGGNTIGIRIPKYKFLIDLLKKTNKPLAQTSANISGKPATTKIGEALKQFGLYNIKNSKNKVIPFTSDRLYAESETFSETFFVDLIIDAGNLPKSKPSKVIDLTGKKKKIIRL